MLNYTSIPVKQIHAQTPVLRAGFSTGQQINHGKEAPHRRNRHRNKQTHTHQLFQNC